VITVRAALAEIARHPAQSLLAGWNWKLALFSALYRAALFFIVALRSGWKAAVSALTLEAAYRVVASGFQGALTQALCNAKPVWLSALLLLVIVPACLQAIEFAMHWIAGTPGLWTAFLFSTVATAVASLFSWFAMRRGAFLVGEAPVARDLKRVPQLILDFILFLPRAVFELKQKAPD
jgi:hypothetical protein